MKRILYATLAALALPVLSGDAAEYEVDPVGSYVLFEVSHFKVGACHGRFNEFSGSIEYDPANPDDSALQFTVKAASIDTGNQKRDDHLRNSDFFDVVKFPEIRFESSSVKGGKVTGELTMHGVTKTITADFDVVGIGQHLGNKKELLGATATFKVKRSDFGMTYGVPDAVGDEVTMRIAVEALRR